MKTYTTRLREVLRANPDGLTVQELTVAIGRTDDVVRGSLKYMPDVYVDRWVLEKKDEKGKPYWRAVWCVVVPPPDCPKPNFHKDRPVPPNGRPRGQANACTKVPRDVVLKCRSLWHAGESIPNLAKKFQVSTQTMHKVCKALAAYSDI